MIRAAVRDIQYLPSQQNMKVSSPSISRIIRGSVKMEECFSEPQGWDVYLPSRSGPMSFVSGTQGLIRAGGSQTRVGWEMIARPHFIMQTAVILTSKMIEEWEHISMVMREGVN